ncbi:DinB family protein [Microbacteriaceae bacterium VKM Ac-2855]|nr:DinB family protein [Microbacteriaceae bacterium VKM Ac-2855]
MTASIDLLRDAFGRIHDTVISALDGATAEDLAYRVDPESNSIAWLVWHLTRVQDNHLSPLAEREQAWIADGWFEKSGLPFSPKASGYGQSPAEVAAVGALGGKFLRDYFLAVHDRSLAYIDTLADDDLARVVDTRWDPPVTLGVRLISVLDDDLQHAGQAAFVKGVAQRAR